MTVGRRGTPDRLTLVVLGAITALGALVRILSPGRIALWADEVQFLDVSSLPSIRAIVGFLWAHESHPPLFYFLAHFIGLFTTAVSGVMSVLVLVGAIAVIPAAWWVGTLDRRRGAGAAAALLVAVSLPLAFLQVQLRPYGFVSLLLLLSVGAAIKAHRGEGRRWNATWVMLVLLLLYVHHLAIVVVAAEASMLLLASARRDGAGRAIAAWAPWFGAAALLALPDLAMLLHQERVTGYLPGGSVASLFPFRQFGRLALSFPGELALPLAASIALLSGARGPSRATGAHADDAGVTLLVAGTFVILCLAMILSAYRQSLLVEHVVLPIAPLGLVGVGVLIARALDGGRRGIAAVWIQVSVVATALSSLFTIGISKTSMDLMAGYVDAEAHQGDLVMLFPGSFGTVLNHYLTRPLSQVNYPVVGPVQRFAFDHSFEHIVDTTYLARAFDSMAAVAERGGRVWYIGPTKWLVDDTASTAVEVDRTAGEAQAYRARSWQIRRQLRRLMGPPHRVMTSAPESWTMEALSLDRFGTGQGRE